MRKRLSVILVSVLSLSVVTFALILPVYASDGRNQPSNTLGIPQQPQVLQTLELPEDSGALVYTDDAELPASERYPIVALENLGIPYVHYADDYNGFRTALLSQTWDLVVVSHNAYYEFGDNWTELEQHVLDGGRLVLTTFDIDGSHSEPTTLWATLGAEYRSNMSLPEPVYRWEPTHPIFTDPNTVGDLTACSDEYIDDGDHVAVTTGTALAGFTTTPAADDAAIVEANGGNTVVMSFLLCEFDGDEDSDGKLDAVELWENAITYVRGPAGLYAGGSEPGIVYEYLGGTSWQAVSPDLGYSVLCLCEYGGNLYAGTAFGQVWRYDGGTTWTLVGDNMDDEVCALVIFRGDLYAGTAWNGGRLYRYDGGTTWTMVVDYAGWSGFKCLYVWNDIMYIGDIGFDLFGHYDGTTFTYDADLGGSCIWDFEVYNNALYASAWIGRIHRSFDGSTWSTIRDYQDYDSWELETFQDYLYVTTGPKLERYDGTGFSLVWTEPNGYEISSMISVGNGLIMGVGEVVVSRRLVGGRVYTYDGTQVQLISGDMGSGIQDLFGFVGLEDQDSCFLPGDVNNDSILTIDDITDLFFYLYSCESIPCFEASDANGNCEIDLGDVAYLINHMFKGGPAPVPYCSNPDAFSDPGEKDTVRLEIALAKPGKPFVIPVSIFNDNSVLVNIPLKIEDTTRVVLDSIVFEGTRGQGILSGVPDYSCEGTTGILIYTPNPNDPLSDGFGISGYLWGHVKEGADTGFVKLDTSFLEPTHQLRFFKGNTYSLMPEFVFGGVTVLPPYICGDVDGNGLVELADIVYFINYLFRDGDPPKCPPPPYTWCADANGDGEVALADIVYLINYVLKSGPEPSC